MWRCFWSVVVSTLMLVCVAGASAVASQARFPQPQTPPEQTAQARAVTGTITSVSGLTFSIEVGQGASKQTLQFVMNAATAKSGELRVGATATVEYRVGAGGRNMATKVSVQG